MKRNPYLGLFLITLATLTYEILLTRIFSVTMWYHFAFVAVSVAMVGMTAGAIVVYLRPNYFAPDKTSYHLALRLIIVRGLVGQAWSANLLLLSLSSGLVEL